MKAKLKRRCDLLTYKPKGALNRIPFTTTYDPRVHHFFKHIKTLLKSLGDNLPHVTQFQNPPVLALKQPPNLRSLLVRSKLPKGSNDGPQGNTPCGNARCLVCKSMMTSTVIHVPGIDKTIHPGPFNCNTSKVVYFITCNLCPSGNYISETQTSFRLRFNNHKSTIRRRVLNFPVSQHFNSPGHNISNLRFFILKSN